MKKSLLALAVFSATLGTAAAADVTLYGDIDTGLAYTYTKSEVGGESEDSNNLEMVNGINSASKFGLKGIEDLGNGLKVGFKLENGFEADDGTFSFDDRIFGREATLSVYSDYGTLTLGRVGSIASATGSYDIVYAIGDAFDGGDEYAFGFQSSGRLDNSITYQTPEIAGLQATLQYSLKTDSKQGDVYADGTEYVLLKGSQFVEGESTADRYFGVAITGTYGPAQFVAAYELQKNSTLYRAEGAVDPKDAQTFYLGGNYDFGVAKIFAMGQYFSGARSFADVYGTKISGDDWDLSLDQLGNPVAGVVGYTEDGIKGYSLHLGTIVPIAAGELTVGAYYSDAKAENYYRIAAVENLGEAADIYNDVDGSYYGIAARYTYPLSNRTTVYLGGSYAEAEHDATGGYSIAGANGVYENYGSFKNDDKSKDKITAIYFGLAHHF